MEFNNTFMFYQEDSNMQKQQGFTLIELIIVIVILGILAVTAAPRFIDLQSDAKESTLQGVKGALQGATQLVYAKSAIAGSQGAATAQVTIGGKTVPIAYGYPDANEITVISGSSTASANAENFIDLDDTQFSIVPASNDNGTMLVVFEGETASNNCYLQYVNAASAGAAPTITSVITGC